MQHAVVQGASRGIGLGLVQGLLGRQVEVVHATCRDPDSASELRALAGPDRLFVHRLDVTDEPTIEAAAAAIRARSPELDLVFNASGVLHGEGLQPERRLEELDPGRLGQIFLINAIGPLLVVKHLLPAISHGRRAVVASLSARVGSIGDNRLGGWYGYRASKAALNQLHRSLAVELSRRAKHAIAVTLHPGTVATRLTEPFRRSVKDGALLTVEEASERLLVLIEGLSPEDHGRFYDGTKSPIEW